MPITRLIAQNFESFSGDTAVFNMTVMDQDAVAKDITGASVRFVMARKPGHTPLVDISTGAGITITDAVNGLLTITIPSAATEPLSGAYAYEVELTDVAGRVATVAFGSIAMRRDTAS